MPAEDAKDVELIETPNCSTIEDLAQFLHIPVEKTIKAVAFTIDGEKTVLCMVRGDHEVNDVAVQNFVGGNVIEPATEDELKAHGLQPGYMSPMGADKPDNETFFVLVDPSAMNVPNGVTGANKAGYHYQNVNPSRDFKDVTVTTIRNMVAGDKCPHCGAPIEIVRGIEVGQVFELGTKYSEALHATFLDQNGKAKPYVMGCYGIGVPVSSKDQDQVRIAGDLYQALQAAKADVLLDDRNERAGVKFNDADLIGYPVRVTVGKKSAAEGTVEIKIRRTSEQEVVPIDQAVARVQEILADLRSKNM